MGEYIGGHNQNPKPFLWTARANDILEKVTRAKTALNKRRSTRETPLVRRGVNSSHEFVIPPRRIRISLPRWARPHVRLSAKKSRMKFANATNFYRKSGWAKWRACPERSRGELSTHHPSLAGGVRPYHVGSRRRNVWSCLCLWIRSNPRDARQRIIAFVFAVGISR